MASPLDHWAQQQFELDAHMLDSEQMLDLIKHIEDTARADVEYWKPRNDRMLEDQRLWEVGGRRGGTLQAKSSRLWTPGRVLDVEDDKDAGAEVVELNDAYTTVDKITAMVSGAGWGLDVPPRNNQMQDAAQQIEDLLIWAEEELNADHSFALNSSITRDEVHYACLRGWICGLVIPNPENLRVPWTYVLADPLFVYPRYSRKGLVRVVYRYTLTTLEARDEFPDSLQYLEDYDDDDEVEIISYYDDRYLLSLITSGTSSKNNQYGSHNVIQPLTEHGYIDIDGNPINPWIIHTPRGTPTRQRESLSSGANFRDVVALIGLGVLHPMKELLLKFEKLVSQLHTQVAKGVNPPRLVYYDGQNPPEPLDLGIGADNYLILGQQEVKPFDTTAMKPDTGPLLQIFTDRLQKAGVPGVFYGNAAGGMSGYAVNLLTQGAKDVVQPILEGLKQYRQLRYRRMLEMYVNIGEGFAGSLYPRTRNRETDQMYTGMTEVTGQAIRDNGVFVRVSYDTLAPRDLMSIVPVGVGAFQAGLLPAYDFAKDFLGEKDPGAWLQRLMETMALKDPRMQQKLGVKAAMNSGNHMVREAAQEIMQENAVMAQQQAAEAARVAAGGEPTKGGTNTAGSPPTNFEGVAPATTPSNIQPSAMPSPPANQNPLMAIINQLRNVSANNNVSNGGSMPNFRGR